MDARTGGAHPAGEDEAPSTVVGSYLRLSVARENGLVLAAQGIAHWVRRRNGSFDLEVSAGDVQRALDEIGKYSSERALQGEVMPEVLPEFGRAGILHFAGSAWVLWGCWVWQQRVGEFGVDRGGADSRAMLAGEWWRAVTALTLHADGGHFLANWIFGTLFCGFVTGRAGFGVGWAWVLCCGALANGLNAVCHWGRPQVSIGASTAVFAALGWLVGGELRRGRGGRGQGAAWLLPLGAGLALLAHLGTGSGATDLMAHLLGFVVGVAAGLGAAGVRASLRGRVLAQWLAGGATLVLLATCWMAAFRGARQSVKVWEAKKRPPVDLFGFAVKKGGVCFRE
jgi:rhomboid protease GluP